MKKLAFITLFGISFSAAAQEEGDTVYTRCPVSVSDTSGYNNFFISHQNATVKTERIKGKLVITIQQRDQFFTLFFREKKLEDGNYKIKVGASKKSEVDAKYSFRADGRASFVNVNTGTVDAVYNKETKLWNLRVSGKLSNLVERSASYYKVKADFFIR